MRPVVLLDALQITVPMSCQDAPAARNCRLHGSRKSPSRKCDAWLVEANERRRLKSEAAKNGLILTGPVPCDSESSAPAASPEKDTDGERQTAAVGTVSHTSLATIASELGTLLEEVQALPDVPALEDQSQNPSSPSCAQQKDVQEDQATRMCDAAAAPDAAEPESLEALKSQLTDMQRELKTKEKTADTQLQAESLVLPRPDPKHSEEHGMASSQWVSPKAVDAGSGVGASAAHQRTVAALAAAFTVAGSTAGDSRPSHQFAQQQVQQQLQSHPNAVGNVNVDSRQVPSRAARGKPRDGQGQKGKKGGNNHEHRAAAHAHLQRGDQDSHARQEHAQYGEMQQHSSTFQEQQAFMGQQDAGFARSGQEFAPSGQRHHEPYLGHAHQAGHDYNAALQGSGYAGKGREFAQTHDMHRDVQEGSFAATRHGSNEGHQGFGHTGMAREFAQPITLHGRLSLSNASVEQASYPGHKNFACASKGQAFAQPCQGQMHETLSLSDAAAAGHHFNADNQASGYAVRRQEFAPAALTELQFNAGHQFSGHIGRGREFLQSQRSRPSEHYEGTPSPVNYLQHRYSNPCVAQSGPRLPDTQGCQGWHSSNTQHTFQHDQAHGSANPSSWQHQGTGQQQQRPVQNCVQFPQSMQAVQPLQNTQQLQIQPMQLQSQATSNGYGDDQLESMLLTQFQPLEFGVRGGQELEDIDFEVIGGV